MAKTKSLKKGFTHCPKCNAQMKESALDKHLIKHLNSEYDEYSRHEIKGEAKVQLRGRDIPTHKAVKSRSDNLSESALRDDAEMNRKLELERALYTPNSYKSCVQCGKPAIANDEVCKGCSSD